MVSSVHPKILCVSSPTQPRSLQGTRQERNLRIATGFFALTIFRHTEFTSNKVVSPGWQHAVLASAQIWGAAGGKIAFHPRRLNATNIQVCCMWRNEILHTVKQLKMYFNSTNLQGKINKTKQKKPTRKKTETVPGLYFKFSFVKFCNDPWLFGLIPVL